MIGKVLFNFFIMAFLVGFGASGILTGLLAIADQYVAGAGWHGEYTGRGAVFFGATSIFIGLALLCFYLSTFIASKTFILMGIMYIISGVSIGTTAEYIPDFVITEYIVPTVKDFVNNQVRPIIERVRW
jgi:hypothetical protein